MSPLWFVLSLVLGIILLAAGIIIGVIEQVWSTWYIWLLIGLGILFIILGIILAIVYFIHSGHSHKMTRRTVVSQPIAPAQVVTTHQVVPAQVVQHVDTVTPAPIYTQPAPSVPSIASKVTFSQDGQYVFHATSAPSVVGGESLSSPAISAPQSPLYTPAVSSGYTYTQPGGIVMH